MESGSCTVIIVQNWSRCWIRSWRTTTSKATNDHQPSLNEWSVCFLNSLIWTAQHTTRSRVQVLDKRKEEKSFQIHTQSVVSLIRTATSNGVSLSILWLLWLWYVDGARHAIVKFRVDVQFENWQIFSSFFLSKRIKKNFTNSKSFMTPKELQVGNGGKNAPIWSDARTSLSSTVGEKSFWLDKVATVCEQPSNSAYLGALGCV